MRKIYDPWDRPIRSGEGQTTEEEFIRQYIDDHPDQPGRDIARALRKILPPRSDGESRSLTCVETKVYRIRRDTPVVRGVNPMEELPFVKPLLVLLKSGPKTIIDIAEEFGVAPSAAQGYIDDLIEMGYSLETDFDEVELPAVPRPLRVPTPLVVEPTTKFVFAVVSDTHFGSRYEQPTSLASFVELAWLEYGVQDVLHVGDLTDGGEMYRGQDRELYAHGIDEQLDAAEERLPERDGLNWKLLGGNHDYSFYRHHSIDVIRHFAERRPDVTRLGYDVYDVPLLPGVDARLWHPTGGLAYAISYKAQKYSTEVAFSEMQNVLNRNKERPTIRFLFVGHFHQRGMFSQGPLSVFLTQCFQSQSPYMKARGMTPYLGGWIIETGLVDDAIAQVTARWVEYQPIENDWRNFSTTFRDPQQKTEVTYLFQS